MLRQVKQTEARDLECSCRTVSSMDEPCDGSGTCHGGISGGFASAMPRMGLDTIARCSRAKQAKESSCGLAVVSRERVRVRGMCQ
jgi:hypothetical protein